MSYVTNLKGVFRISKIKCAVSLLLLLPLISLAQTKKITGSVKDEKGGMLPAVNILLAGKGVGLTDNNGNFSIDAQVGDVVTFTYISYKNSLFTVDERNTYVVEMKEGDRTLDEVVVVGYGTQKKTSLTAAISTVKGADIARQPVGDLSSTLAGRASGVLFTQGTGQAGNDGASIQIRGIGTTGNNSPLYIVDGIPRNYSQLNPSDIETITVLKDAAAVAPYGLGGANGVILVTTKRGKTGKPVLSYDGYVGVQNPTVTQHFINSYQFATMKNAGTLNDYDPATGPYVAPYSAGQLQKYKDGTDPDGYGNVDPVADIFKKNVLQTSHSLSLSGGSESVKYAMGLGYYSQQGNLPGLNYKRYNLSANVEAQATKTTKVSIALNGRVEQRNLTADGFNTTNIFSSLGSNLPNEPFKFSNGGHSSRYAHFYDNASYQKVTGNTLLSQFSLEQQLPIKGLSAKVVAAYDFNPSDPYAQTGNGNSGIVASYTRAWISPPSYTTYDSTVTPHAFRKVTPKVLPTFSQEYHQMQAITLQGYLNYAADFGKSSVTGLVVLESRNTKASMFRAGRTDYLVAIPELFAGAATPSSVSNYGSSSQGKQRSLVYRATYDYDSKYLVEVAGRYDGHYYFAPGKRFGFFPAASAAWRISQEDFMNNISWINELKLRTAFGLSGNLAGGPFQYQSAYNFYTTSAILNGSQTAGLSEGIEANPSITWEKAAKTSVGLDAKLWNGLLTIEADYFQETRDNMLVAPSVTVPIEYGIGLAQENAATMKNKGFEISLGTTRRISKDLVLSFNGNFSYAKNKLTQFFESSSTYDNPNRRQTGRPLWTKFGYKSAGYFTAADFDDKGNLKSTVASQNFGGTKIGPGDIRYADLNNDGKITVDDQTAIGNPDSPGIVYGLSPSVNYKAFEFSLLFQGAAKKDIRLSEDAVWPFFNGKSALTSTLDYWTPENPNASSPKLHNSPTANNTQVSDFWIVNTSYLRLRTMMLSYSLPVSMVKTIGMSSARLYVSGQNILTFSKVKNFDPEVSQNRGFYYPTQKSLTVGINVQF